MDTRKIKHLEKAIKRVSKKNLKLGRLAIQLAAAEKENRLENCTVEMAVSSDPKLPLVAHDDNPQ